MSRNGNEASRARAQAGRSSSGLDMGQLERDISVIVARLMSQRAAEQAQLLEKLQVLLGERTTTDKRTAAVRRSDLSIGLKTLPLVTAAPTADDHNELVKAFNTLVVALADLSRTQ